MDKPFGKKLFTAELQMLKAKGSATPAPDAGTESAQEILSAIGALRVDVQALSKLLQPLPDGAAVEESSSAAEEPPDDREVQILKTEIRALYLAIQQTKAEIAALRPQHTEDDRLVAVTNELDAIVTSTERATHSILESAEKIDTLVEQLEAQTTEGFVHRIAADVRDAVVSVFEACNFQDITGQRITKVVKTLQYIEGRVNKMIEIWGPEAFEDVAAQPEKSVDDDRNMLNGPALENQGVSQADIDKLFG
jgi:chemotaxis protein CheZ